MKIDKISSDIIFEIPQSCQKIIIIDKVLSIFAKHRQDKKESKESGGQLFANFRNNEIIIVKATESNYKDQKTFFSFIPYRKKEQSDIKSFFKNDLHFVGDWHTHPQAMPKPSKTDIKSISECFTLSDHELQRFILIIVGTLPFPKGLWISIHNNNNYLELKPTIN